MVAQYAIQLSRPRTAGDNYTMSSHYAMTMKLGVYDGKTLLHTVDSNYSIEIEADVKVMENEVNSVITKKQYTIRRCTSRVGGKTRQLVPAGTVFTIAKAMGQTDSKFEDEDLPPMVQQQIVSAVVDVSSGMPDETFGTSQPRRIRESWPIDVPNYLLSALTLKNNFEIKPSDLSGSVMLTDTSTIEGVPCLDIDASLLARKFTYPVPNGMKLKKSTAQISYGGSFPEDISMGPRNSTTRMVMDVEATGDPATPARNYSLKAKVEMKTETTYTYRQVE
jgi:hypothetical protein